VDVFTEPVSRVKFDMQKSMIGATKKEVTP
jgi:hypothetical protein